MTPLSFQENTSDGEKKKNMILIGGGVCVACVAVIFLTDAGDGLFGSSNPNADETNMQSLAAAPVPALTDTVEATDEADDDEEEVEEEDVDSEFFDYVSVYLPGDSQKELAWKALKNIDEWRESGQSDDNVMKQYLGHRKVWVRLAAFEVALKQQKLSEAEVQSVAIDLREGHRRDQMRRWLKRVRVRDAETWATMTALLGT